MTNDSIQTTPAGQTFAQWLAGLIRHAADLVALETAKRPTLDALKQDLAYDVQLALLSAQAEEERYRHTVRMLQERLVRLRSHEPGPRHAPVTWSPDRIGAP